PHSQNLVVVAYTPWMVVAFTLRLLVRDCLCRTTRKTALKPLVHFSSFSAISPLSRVPILRCSPHLNVHRRASCSTYQRLAPTDGP
ncbi:uncharacterized protein EDB93DRAFT_1134446, partial [Suillus bovinus]|uniref:uncharacterized protein n=1 Tax=Suillus bovinus TaxID=48563 RepID=UPI001B87E7C8